MQQRSRRTLTGRFVRAKSEYQIVDIWASARSEERVDYLGQIVPRRSLKGSVTFLYVGVGELAG